MTKLAARVEAWAFRLLMALPPWLVRRLAGRPVVVDGQTLDAETQWMLRVQKLAGDPGLTGETVAEIRRDTRRQTRLAGGRQRIGRVRDLELPGGDGPVPARLYTPRSRVGSTVPSPLLFFIHGGGMVFGDLDTHDATCRLFAERADTLVLAIDYRLAPEHPFPAAVDDCWAAFAWVAEHAASLGADPGRVAVVVTPPGARCPRSPRSRPPRQECRCAASCWSTRRRTWRSPAGAGSCSVKGSS